MANDMSPIRQDTAPARGHAPRAAPAVPGILLNTLPKSGSIYLVTALREGLALQQKSVSLGYFPIDLADWQGIRALRSGGMIAQTHLDASPANLQIFEHYLDRWIVHVRDPRQALLSWVHHLAKYYVKRGHPAFESCPAAPAEYYGWSLGRQIDWQIGVYLPQAVGWIEDWLRYAQTMRSKVLITSFEDLVRSEPIFMRTILDFLGIPHALMRRAEVKKTEATHFRMGRVDEWVEVFTPDQARSATKLIPDALLREFRWRA
jgi:hypothetical protein